MRMRVNHGLVSINRENQPARRSRFFAIFDEQTGASEYRRASSSTCERWETRTNGPFGWWSKAGQNKPKKSRISTSKLLNRDFLLHHQALAEKQGNRPFEDSR